MTLATTSSSSEGLSDAAAHCTHLRPACALPCIASWVLMRVCMARRRHACTQLALVPLRLRQPLAPSFPLATSAAFLAWGVLEFEGAYAAAGELGHAREGIRWIADYLMACHCQEGSYIGQIGEPGLDHAYWGRPEVRQPAAGACWCCMCLPTAHGCAGVLLPHGLLIDVTDPLPASAVPCRTSPGAAPSTCGTPQSPALT